MTGAEHYEAAEKLLSAASVWSGDPLADIDAHPISPAYAERIAAAQVHATLALADAQRRSSEATENFVECSTSAYSMPGFRVSL